MASEGPNIPGTAANDSSQGDEAWTNPSNATNDGTSVADAINSGTDEQTFWLKCTNYPFSAVTGTIDGIEVEINGMIANDGTHVDGYVGSVKLVKGGAISGLDRGDSFQIPGIATDRTYGGASDLWGLAWTPADITSSNFGVAITFFTNRNDTYSVDTVKITVHYTAGAGGASLVSRTFPRGLLRALNRRSA